MSLIVRRAGASSFLVDGGRPHSLHQGVPCGGPADRASWLLGNALVGNHVDGLAMTAVEITLHGPMLEATARHDMVIYGASFPTQLRRKGSEQSSSIPVGHVFTVEAGDELSIGNSASKSGLRAYLCVAGGIKSPMILESQSSFEPVKSGATLECSESTGRLPHRWIALEPWQEQLPGHMLRLIAGTHLTRKLRSIMEEAKFTVRPESNRMGLRLSSDVTWPQEGSELVSAPVTPGTIQLPPGGQPILLGVDAQTIGGYPRLGHVIRADFDRIGQLKPGDTVGFAVVTLEEAERLEQSRSNWLRTWLERIRWSA